MQINPFDGRTIKSRILYPGPVIYGDALYTRIYTYITVGHYYYYYIIIIFFFLSPPRFCRIPTARCEPTATTTTTTAMEEPALLKLRSDRKSKFNTRRDRSEPFIVRIVHYIIIIQPGLFAKTIYDSRLNVFGVRLLLLLLYQRVTDVRTVLLLYASARGKTRPGTNAFRLISLNSLV